MLRVTPNPRPSRPDDRRAAEALLSELGLPLAGLDACFSTSWVAETGDGASADGPSTPVSYTHLTLPTNSRV